MRQDERQRNQMEARRGGGRGRIPSSRYGGRQSMLVPNSAASSPGAVLNLMESNEIVDNKLQTDDLRHQVGNCAMEALATNGWETRSVCPRPIRAVIPTAAQLSRRAVIGADRYTAALPSLREVAGIQAASGEDDGGWSISRREYLFAALAASGTGATAGGAASGVIGGGSTGVDQAVIIRDIETYASGGGLSVVDSSNTDFLVGVDVRQGERYVLHLLVDNRADEKANQRFRFDEIPEPLSVEVFGDPPTGVDVQAAAHTEWAVNIEPEHPTGLPSPTSVPDDEQIIEVLVEVANTAAPRTYELNGTLEPTSL